MRQLLASMLLVGLMTRTAAGQPVRSGGADDWATVRAVATVAGTTVAVLGAVFVARFVPIVRGAPNTTPSSLREAQLADLAYLRTLPRYDRSLREPGIRRSFESFVDSVAADTTPCTPAEFELAVARAVTIADNGHSNVSAAARARRLASDLPIRVARFAEGYFIVQATTGHEDLISHRLEAIDGVAVKEILGRLSEFHGGPVERASYQAHLDLASPAVLQAIGVGRSAHRVTVVLAAPDGGRRSVDLNALPIDSTRRRPAGRASYLFETSAADSVEGWRSLMAGREPPIPLREAGEAFSMELLNGGAGVYARIGANANVGDSRVKPFASRVVDEVVRRRARFVVIDLRDNAGGTTTLRGFARGLIDALPADGRVYVITSPGTFSYGIATAALLRKHGGERTVLVGEPMGDRLAFWANGGSTFRLRHSGIALRAWSGREDYASGCWNLWECFWFSPFFLRSGVGELRSGIVAPLSFADYRSGRDTALEAILRLEGGGP